MSRRHLRLVLPGSDSTPRPHEAPTQGAGPAGKGVEERITKLPDAGREEQLEYWGLSASHTWAEAQRWGSGPEDVDATDDNDEAAAHEFLASGGWHAIDARRHDERRGGTTAHRGVLAPGEYVDPHRISTLVEKRLGFTVAQVRSVYRHGGRLTQTERDLRDRIDMRLLEIANDGGNMTMLATSLGFSVKPDGSCRIMTNALRRARQAEAA